MEPFGLFQFLKSILSQPDQSLEKNDDKQAENGENHTPTANAVGVETVETIEEKETNSFNAYVNFAQAHDARASKLKR